MRILGPIVLPSPAVMQVVDAEIEGCCAVGPQIIRDQPPQERRRISLEVCASVSTRRACCAWTGPAHTQPKVWETLAATHDGAAESVMFHRLRKQLDDRGTLDVLRHGVEMIGLRHPISFAQFKPALAMNADIVARYTANRLRVVRQVPCNSEVFMATRLEGSATTFLPFNKGDHDGKGNPPNPEGHPTSYLWKEVWARDLWKFSAATSSPRRTRRSRSRS